MLRTLPLLIVLLLTACAGSSSSTAPRERPAAPPLHEVRVLLVAQERPSLFRLDSRVSALLSGSRISVSSHASLDDLTPGVLAPYDLVVLYQHRMVPRLTPAIRRGLAALRSHAEAGGGLLVTKDLYSRRGRGFYQALLGPLGAEMLHEQLVERDPRYTRHLATLKAPAGLFAWTDALVRGHPVTRGVRGLYYSVGRWQPGEPGTLPLRVDGSWTVLARGRASAASVTSRPTGFDPAVMSAGQGSYGASPPLLAVRALGKGRVALWPTLASFTLLDGYSPVLEEGLVMGSSQKHRPSDGARLLTNLMRWLAPRTPPGKPAHAPPDAGAGSGAAATPRARSPALTWGRRTGVIRPAGARGFKGIIGVFSRLSGGRDSPAELMAAARAAGYDFIAFAEDLSQLKPRGWRSLLEQCRQGTTSRFTAMPGLRYRGADGDPFIVLGAMEYPPASWADPRVPGKKILHNGTVRMALDPVPAIIYLPLPANRRPARLHGAFFGHALEVWRGDKRLVEDLDGYLSLQREGLGLFPTAVHLVDSAEQVARAARGRGLQAWIRADRPEQLLDSVQGLSGARGHYFRAGFASSGPEIVAFTATNWGTSDLTQPGRERFRLQLRVRAGQGLAQVRLLDEGRLHRRFLPGGAKEFSTWLDGNHDRQHAFVVVATDLKGQRAVSWARTIRVQELHTGMSGDNLNDLGLMGKVQLDRGRVRLRGTELVARLAAPGVFRQLAALAAEDPAGAGRVRAPGRHASMQRSLLVSRFGAITEHTLDRLWSGPGLPGIAHATPVVDNPNYSGVIRRIRLARLPPGPDVELRELTVTLKRPLRMRQSPGVVLATSASRGLAAGQQDQVIFPDGAGGHKIWRPTRAQGRQSRVVRLLPGDFVGAFPQLTAVFALDKPLYALVAREFDAGRGKLAAHPVRRSSTVIQVGLGQRGQVLPAGAVLRARLALLTLPRAENGQYPWWPGHRDFWPTAELAHKVRAGLGLSGPPTYLIKPTVGRLTGSGLLLRLASSGGGFSAEVSRSDAPLPLPALLSGLNPRWSAVLWYRGDNRILSTEWPPGWFKGVPRHHRYVRLRQHLDPIYPLGVGQDGVALLQLDLHDGDRDLFAGHPVTCDRADFPLGFLYDSAHKTAEVEVHNPTDRAARVKVRPGQGFDLFGDFSREVKVDSGKSIYFKLQLVKP